MNSRYSLKPNPKLDLILEKVVDVPKEMIWKGWTKPENLKKFFVPKPWTLAACEVDLRPGGAFMTTMRSPDGQEFPGIGCFLEIVENERLVWTSALLPGYRPIMKMTNGHDMLFTGVIQLESQGAGTKYTAMTIHADEETKNTHEKMGFHEGWGIVLGQLVNEIKSGNIK